MRARVCVIQPESLNFDESDDHTNRSGSVRVHRCVCDWNDVPVCVYCFVDTTVLFLCEQINCRIALVNRFSGAECAVLSRVP